MQDISSPQLRPFVDVYPQAGSLWPAGQAIAAQVERVEVPDTKKLLFCRACGASELDSQQGRHYTIDVPEPASRPRVQEAKVLVVTTGTAFKAVDHWPRNRRAYWSILHFCA